MINRRSVLGYLAGAGAASASFAATGSNVKAPEAHGTPGPARNDGHINGHQLPVPEIDGRLLVNRSRAHDVMEQFDLVGLLAMDPINVYYLTNVSTLGYKFRSQYPGFAAYARDPEQPIFLVSGTSSTWDVASRDRETAELIAFGHGASAEIQLDPNALPIEPYGATARAYSVSKTAKLTPREQRWANAQESVNKNLAANAAWGMARALKEQGITRGRVAVDDIRIAAMLAETDMVNIQCVPSYGIFQHIRMVKTEQELAYQRIGGRNNGDACLATLRSMQPGMSHDDLEQIFRFECAKRGNEAMGFIAGFPGGGFPDNNRVVEGKPFLVDAVSHFKQYHGDFARTFMFGEPSGEVEKRRRANQLARDAVFDAIRPGIKFSDLRRIGTDTMVKHGIPPEMLFVTPHSVGLQHGDSPYSLPEFGVSSMDHVLEENMVLTVDLPYLEVGYGSGHNEDLFRVTSTGYEALNTEEDPFLIL